MQIWCPGVKMSMRRRINFYRVANVAAQLPIGLLEMSKDASEKNELSNEKRAMIWPWLSGAIASERLGRSLHVFRCVSGPITGHPTMMILMWLRFDQSTDATFSPIDLVVQTVALNANKSSAVDEIGDRLTTVDMGRKIGGCCVVFWGDRRSEAEATAGHNHWRGICPP